jgi:hypothetical protein
MYYGGGRSGVSPVCDEFLKYKLPFCDSFDDFDDDIVILPEVYIPVIHLIKNAKRVIWWLSVDNAKFDEKDEAVFKTDASILHFAQSQYAMDFLKAEGIAADRILYLSDYIDSDFLLPSPEGDGTVREDVVLFNPYKGFQETMKLLAASDAGIAWRVLRGATPEQMRYYMRHSKVYIDFGNHPGKDRIPREAALSGCCVLTNREGSAANDVDVPLPEKYKFQEMEPKKIIQIIKDLFRKYDTEKHSYDNYVEIIKQEYLRFEIDVLSCFEQIASWKVETYGSEEEFLVHMSEAVKQKEYLRAYRLLVKYCQLSLEETVELDILETEIRMGIGEICEARLSALRGLKKDPDCEQLQCLLEEISGCLSSMRE